jgi:hypothetical protein
MILDILTKVGLKGKTYMASKYFAHNSFTTITTTFYGILDLVFSYAEPLVMKTLGLIIKFMYPFFIFPFAYGEAQCPKSMHAFYLNPTYFFFVTLPFF